MNWPGLLDSIFDAMPTPFFFKDREGCYRMVNQTFAARIIGLPKELIIGKRLADFSRYLAVDLLHNFQRKDQELLAHGGAVNYEAEVRTAQGEVRGFTFYKAAVPGPDDGSVVGIAGAMTDNAHCNILVDSTVKEAKLEAAIETAGAVCHAINQPLQVSLTEMEYLSRALTSSRHAESANNILSCLHDIAGLTRKLQHISSYQTQEYVDGFRILNIDLSARSQNQTTS